MFNDLISSLVWWSEAISPDYYLMAYTLENLRGVLDWYGSSRTAEFNRTEEAFYFFNLVFILIWLEIFDFIYGNGENSLAIVDWFFLIAKFGYWSLVLLLIFSKELLYFD